MTTRLLTIGLTALLSQSGFAHDGDHHGSLATTLWHLLIQPDHWLVLLAVIGLAAAGFSKLRRSTKKHINSNRFRSHS